MARDEFPLAIKQVVAARAGYRCSNPACRAATSGPQLDERRAINIGVAAHITAAATGGPRYDDTLTKAERGGGKNAIWLCQTCSKLIDSDPSSFTIRVLNAWKGEAEQAALRTLGKTSPEQYTSYSGRAVPLLDSYLGALGRYCGAFPYLSLHGLTASRTLARVYVTPEVGHYDRHEENVRNDANLRRYREEFLASEYLKRDEHRHSFLWGRAGAGKSTVLRDFAANAWNNCTRVGLVTPHIPMLVSLRRLGLTSGSIEQRLNHLVSSELVLPQTLPHGFLEQWPIEVQVPWLFLLDGLDEVHPRVLPSVFRFIEALAVQCPSARIVVSSRPLSYLLNDSKQAQFAQFAHFDILPFTKLQVLAFAGKWFPGSEEKFVDEVARVRRGELSGTPLLLTIAAIVFHEGKSLPKNRSNLYQEAIRIWVTEAEFQGLHEELDHRVLKLSTRVLSRVARRMTDRGHSNTDELVREAAAALQDFLNVSSTESMIDAAQMLKVLGRRSGFFVERSGRYEFFHPTFREYLTAVSFVEASADLDTLWQLILRLVTDYQWREVALFAYSMLSARGVDISHEAKKLLPPSRFTPSRSLALAASGYDGKLINLLERLDTLTTILLDGGVVGAEVQCRMAGVITTLLDENAEYDSPLEYDDIVRLLDMLASLEDSTDAIGYLRAISREDEHEWWLRLAAFGALTRAIGDEEDIEELYTWGQELFMEIREHDLHEHYLMADIIDLLFDLGRVVESEALASQMIVAHSDDSIIMGITHLTKIANHCLLSTQSVTVLVSLYCDKATSAAVREKLENVLCNSTVSVTQQEPIKRLVKDSEANDWLRCDAAVLLSELGQQKLAVAYLRKLGVRLSDSYARAYAIRVAAELQQL